MIVDGLGLDGEGLDGGVLEEVPGDASTSASVHKRAPGAVWPVEGRLADGVAETDVEDGDIVELVPAAGALQVAVVLFIGLDPPTPKRSGRVAKQCAAVQALLITHDGPGLTAQSLSSRNAGDTLLGRLSANSRSLLYPRSPMTMAR